ncbi:hypothetical protein [Ferrovibrio sp.]|uniref:hypothetical protein n=1 Tax=Ferrovibrio sp. TaxID=1917215 RepID=UPI002601C996|nr:hypothetical protein [Ferrovibrio sp.]
MQSLQRSLATACLLVGLILPIAAHADGVEELRDPQNRLLGKIINRHDGLKEARSTSNQLLGRYDPDSNETRSANNTLFGRGNQLAVLIYSSSRTAQQAEPQRPPMTASVQPSQDRPRQTLDGNRGVVLPEVAARWARTTSAATAEDRQLAKDAFQRAGEALGREQFWQNPSSGNSGSILLHADQKAKDTFYHGKLVPCYFGRMTLHAGGETDVQRQLVCKMPHNQYWTTVQVETD